MLQYHVYICTKLFSSLYLDLLKRVKKPLYVSPQRQPAGLRLRPPLVPAVDRGGVERNRGDLVISQKNAPKSQHFNNLAIFRLQVTSCKDPADGKEHNIAEVRRLRNDCFE